MPSLAKMAGRSVRQRRRKAQRQKGNQATVRGIGDKVWKSESWVREESVCTQNARRPHRRAFQLPHPPTTRDQALALFFFLFATGEEK